MGEMRSDIKLETDLVMVTCVVGIFFNVTTVPNNKELVV